MADNLITTNITAHADFTSLRTQLAALTTQLLKLQETTVGTNAKLGNQIAVMNKAFSETLRSTGQYSTHFVTLSSDVEKFGKNLDSGKLKLSQYFRTWQDHTKKSGGLIKDLAKQQVMLEQAIIQPLGKNAQGMMQYNIQVAKGLDLIKNKTALARQEAAIMNKVMLDGSSQLINWGKNTQWAGRQLTVGLTVPLIAFGSAAQRAFKEADAELVRLTKVYGGLSAVSAGELAKVRKDVSATAKEIASSYGVAYKDTISLAADLAATGKQGNDLLQATQQTTRLAVLGEVDRQDAMKATLAIQNAFKQNTEELTQSIDFLNAVENQTSTSLADLTQAIPKAGPVIKALGGDVKDLALYLTAMKEGGVNAAEGANAIKSAMASLINPTKVVTEQFAGFGIDLKGIVNKNAGDLTGTILALQGALDKLNPLDKSKAIEQLFGKFQFARMSALFENLGKQGSQTLQVMDLMKASAVDLANISNRELKLMTESASGQFKRAYAAVQADLASTGEQFLRISTKVLKVVDGIIKFFQQLPGPVKTFLNVIGGITAVAGPLIMLTGVLGNFVGYVIKGVFHLKSLIKGGQGFKLLTPEIVAAMEAGKGLQSEFYNDAEATKVLTAAVDTLAQSFMNLEIKANAAKVSMNPAINTVANSVIIPGQAQIAGTSSRVVDRSNPLIGSPYSRQMAHLTPAGTPQAGTIFGVVPNPGPVNLRIGKNPQSYMHGDMPKIPGVTSVNGISTGIVAEEAAKWHAMTGALAMQSDAELKVLKTEVSATGTITRELSDSYHALLPEFTTITKSAADEVALIVKDVETNKINVDQARARIIALNAEVETMLADTARRVAATQGRTVNLTTVPFTGQPAVTPTGKSNMKELFHKGPTATIVDKVARGLGGVRTSGAGYSIHTTTPRFNDGGLIENFGSNKTQVSGPASINYDDRLGSVPVGGYVLNQAASMDPRNAPLVQAAASTYNVGGKITAMLTPKETVFGAGIQNNSELLQAVHAANNGTPLPSHMAGGRIIMERPNYGAITPKSLAALISRLTKRGPKLSPELAKGRDLQLTAEEAIAYQARALGPNTRRASIGSDRTYYFVGNWGGRLRSSVNSALAHGAAKKSDVVYDLMHGTASEALPSLTRFLQVHKVHPDKIADLTERARAGIVKDLAGIGNIGEAEWSRIQHKQYADIAKELRLTKQYRESLNVPGQRRAKSLDPSRNGYDRETAISPYNAADLNSLDVFNEKYGTSYMGSYRNYEIPKIDGKPTVLAHMMPGYALGGPIISSKKNYGAMPSWIIRNEKVRSLGNQDPLHGPLQIGKYQPAMHVRNQRIAPSVRYNSHYHEFTMDRGPSAGKTSWIPGKTGVAPAFEIGDIETRAKTALFNYMHGDYSAINDPAVQTYLSTIRTKFTGTLHRGVRNPQSLPPVISNLIQQGKWSELIGKEFIMRRSSWSKNPDTAEGFGQLQMVASVKNRNAVPASEIFPDLTFHSPSGPIPVNESEVYMGGKFRVVAASKNKLKLEAIYDAARENGGQVNAGRPYLVGEKGPELFVPRNSGGIIPAYQIGGLIRRGKNAYGRKGNPAARAAQEAAKKARAAAYVPAPVEQSEFREGPLSVGKSTTIGYGGVRTNIYGLQGSFPEVPGLKLPFQKFNMELNSSLSSIGTSLKSASSKLITNTKMIPGQIKASFTPMANSIKNIGNQIVTATKTAGNNIKAAGSYVNGWINPQMRGVVAPGTSGTGVKNTFAANLRYSTGNMFHPISYIRNKTNGGESRPQPILGPDGNPMIDKTTGKPLMTSGNGGPRFTGTSMMTQMAASTAGYAVGQKFGGTTGGIVGSMAAPMAIQGGFKAFNAIKSSGRFAALAGGAGLAEGAAALAALALPLAAVTAAVVIGIKLWKDHKEAVRVNALGYGMTAEAAKKAGLKFKDYNSVLKDSVQNAKDVIARNKLVYESMASSGTPLNLTIKEYQKLKKEVKSVYADQIKAINNTNNNQQAFDLAVRLKEQLIAGGMAADEATKKIYTMFSLSDKSNLAVKATAGSKPFAAITDAKTSSVQSVIDYGKIAANPYAEGSYQMNQFNTALQGIDAAIQERVTASEVAAKKDITGKKQALTYLEAQKQQLDLINSSAGTQQVITQKTLDELKRTNPEIRKIINGSDTIVSVWQKIKLSSSGFLGDLSKFSASQIASLDQMRGSIEATVVATNKLGILKGQYANLDKLTAQQKALQNATKGQTVQQQINTRDALSGLQKQIDANNKLAEARLAALDAAKAEGDLANQIAKKQAEYQAAIATGNDAQAQQASLDIKGLQSQQQYEAQRKAITDATTLKNGPLQAQIDAINSKQTKLGDKAALAGEQLGQVTDKLINQKTKIDNVNGAMIALELNAAAAGKSIEDYANKDKTGQGLAAQVIAAVKAAGGVMPATTDASGKPISVGDQAAVLLKQYNLDGKVGDALRILGGGKTLLDVWQAIRESKGAGKIVQLDNVSTNSYGGGTWLDIAKSHGSKSKDLNHTGTSSTVIATIITENGLKAGDAFILNGVKYNVKGPGSVVKDGNYKPPATKAAGGHILGAGSSTSDSIPAMLSNGEYVVKASAVQAYGVPFFDAANAKRLAAGGPVGETLSTSNQVDTTAMMPLITKILKDQKNKKKTAEQLNAYQKFMLGAGDDPDLIDKMFGIDSIFKLLAGKGSSGDAGQALLGILGGSGLAEGLAGITIKGTGFGSRLSKTFVAMADNLANVFTDAKNKKADGGLILEDPSAAFKSYFNPYIEQRKETVNKKVGGDDTIQDSPDVTSGKFTESEKQVSDLLHSWTGLLNTYYGAKYEALFKSKGLPSLLDTPIVTDLEIADPRNWASMFGGYDKKYGSGAAGGFGFQWRDVNNQLGSMIYQQPTSDYLIRDITLPQSTNGFLNDVDTPEGASANFDFAKYSEKINKLILTNDDAKMSVINILNHEFGHALQGRLALIGKESVSSKLFKDINGIPLFRNKNANDMSELSADFIGGQIMSEMYNNGYTKNILKPESITKYLKANYSKLGANLSKENTDIDPSGDAHAKDSKYRFGAYLQGFKSGNTDYGMADYLGIKPSDLHGDTKKAKSMVEYLSNFKLKSAKFDENAQTLMPDLLNTTYAKTLGLNISGKTAVPRKALNIKTPHDFGIALITALGGTPNEMLVGGVQAWAMQEGGHWKNNAKFNPLNTTLPLGKSHNANTVNKSTGSGVQSYESWDQGLEATLQTLNFADHGYDKIRSALTNNNAKDLTELFTALNESDWGYPKYNFDANNPFYQNMTRYNPDKPYDPNDPNTWYSQFPTENGLITIPAPGENGLDMNEDPFDSPTTPDWWSKKDPLPKGVPDTMPGGGISYSPKTKNIDYVDYAYPLKPMYNFESGTLQDASNSIPRIKTRSGVSISTPQGVYNMFSWKGKKWAKAMASGGELFELDDNEVIDVTGKRAAQATITNVIDRPKNEPWYYWPNGGIGTTMKKLPANLGTSPSLFESLNDALEKFFLSRNGETGFKNGNLSKEDNKAFLKFKYNSVDNAILQNYAQGGLVGDFKIPKFEDGINVVPANMLAMLHANEAVVPANMNPFNPNASNATMGGATYNITNNINGYDGDLNQLSNIVTQKTITAIKTLDSTNAKMVGTTKTIGIR
jgi:TP901 family phage tail tape measure protein